MVWIPELQPTLFPKFFPIRSYRSILCQLHTHSCMIKSVSEILQVTAKEKAEGVLLSLMAPQSICDSTRYLASRHQRHICRLSQSACATRADLPLIWAFYVDDLQKASGSSRLQLSLKFAWSQNCFFSIFQLCLAPYLTYTPVLGQCHSKGTFNVRVWKFVENH